MFNLIGQTLERYHILEQLGEGGIRISKSRGRCSFAEYDCEINARGFFKRQI